MSIVEIKENIDVLELTDHTEYVILENIVVNTIQIIEPNFFVRFRILGNKSFTCGCILDVENVSGSIDILAESGASLSFQLGVMARGKNNLSITTTLCKNNSNATVRVRVVGKKKSYTILKTTGILPKNTKNNTFLEEVKYLMEDTAYIECFPELLVSSDDVVANHNNTIGQIDKEEMFYLLSKGISEKKAIDFIHESFLKSMLIRKEE